MIHLAEFLSQVNSKFSSATYLIGGLVDRGFSNNDIDILQSEYAYRKPFLTDPQRSIHLIHPEKLGRQPSSPLLPIGAPTLWDYADANYYPPDDFLNRSSLRWLQRINQPQKVLATIFNP